MTFVKGKAALDKAFQELATLDKRAGKRVFASGLRAGNKVILEEIKDRLKEHRESGDLEKSYVQRARSRRGVPQNDLGVTADPAGWRWHFLEYGTKWARAFPHVRNSTDSKMGAAERAAATTIEKGLARNFKRLERKGQFKR